MRPLDPRVLPHLTVARGPLAVVVAGGLLSGLLIVVQAFAAAALVVGLLGGESGTWRTPALWLLAATVGRALLGWLGDVAAARAAGRVGVHLRQVVLDRVLDDGAAPSRPSTGALTTLATRGVAAVEPYLTRYLPTLVVAASLPVLVLVTIAWLDWLSALIVVLTLPLVPVFAILIGLTTREKADRQWRALADLAGHFVDVVRGLPTLVAHRRAEVQVDTVRQVTHRYRRTTGDTLRLAFASSAALELIATISVAIVAVAVGLRLAGGGMDLQVALTVLLLAPEAYLPLRRVGAEYHAAAEGTATFEEIHALTSAPRPAAGTGQINDTAPRPIRVNDLTVERGGRRVLTEVTAEIPATGLTAIVGPSGCGKSTLLQTLLGEVPATAGQLRAGDQDLAAIDPESWRRLVAQIAQRPWLSAGSLASNLRVGRPDADDAALWRALRTVGLADDVRALPEGLEATLGDGGAGLSAGQRARLALARVIVADRPYVLLDEPSAHLDDTTEQVMLSALADLARTRCVVVVAHRPAVVAAADHVIDLGERTGLDGRSLAGGSVVEPDRAPARAVSRPPQPTEHDDHRPPPRWRWPLAVLLGTLSAASGVALTATAGWLIARAAEQPPILMLTIAIVGVRTFGLARPVLRYAERLLSHDVALGMLAERRAQVYAALVPLVPARIGRRGDALTQVVDDVDALVDERLRVRLPILTAAGVSVLAIVVTGAILPAAGAVVAGVCLTGVLSYLLARIGTARAEHAFVAARAELGREVLDAVSDARELILWRASGPVAERIAATGRRQAAAAQHAVAATGAGRAVALLAASVGMIGVAAVGAPALSAGQVSAPMLALLVLLPLALVDVLAPLADAGALRVRTRAAAARLGELTTRTPAVSDPVDPRPLPTGAVEITLDRVRVGWDDIDTLDDLSLSLTPGRHVGVTGPSGSGKSTLAALLMRFLTPRDGHHRINAVDVARTTGDDVRRLVGLLDDDPHLFASTVAENVRFARPDADDAAVAAALRAAHLGPWLDTLPDGLATRLGDGGRDVSGGERARIGLARALLADQPVLVLDEPTAHLDGATARAVARDLLAASAGRSLVWITHDGIGLGQMDRVVDLGEQRAPAESALAHA